MKVDVLHVDLLNPEKLTIGGLILLKGDIDGEYRLLLKDSEGMREIKWGLPSPGLAPKYPDNPGAKNARFQINTSISSNKHFEIYLNDNKIIEIKL